MGATKHLLGFLAGTVEFGITHEQGGSRHKRVLVHQLGQKTDNVMSISPYITMMCKDPVSFTVGVQGATAQLSLEAHLEAEAVNMKEAVFVRT